MAADSRGPKNEPQYAGGGAPADAADLTELGAFTALMGNRRVGTTAERQSLKSNELWFGLEWFDTDVGVPMMYTGSAWVVIGAPGVARVVKGGYTANSIGGGQVMASRAVPRQKYAQRVVVRATGSVGFGGTAGYVTATLSWTGTGVTVSSNGKDYTLSPTDAGAENGVWFTSGRFVGLAREFDVTIPANTDCTLTVRSDASVEAFYRTSIHFETYAAGEYV